MDDRNLPPIHVTLNQGLAIACDPAIPRSSVNPLPLIVELADSERATCPACKRIAEEIRRRPDDHWNESSAFALDRIAGALERIASVLEDPRNQVDQVLAHLHRSR